MSCHVCEASNAEEQLYRCKFDGCNSNIYCESCGNAIHRKKNHKFSENMGFITPNTGYEINENEEDEKYAPNVESASNPQSKESYDTSWIKSGIKSSYNKAKEKPQLVGVGAGVITVGCLTGIAPIAAVKVAAVGMFATAAHTIYSSYNNSKGAKEDKKADAVEVALGMFQYSAEDINNTKCFNVTQIQKRYRRFAKFYHPDKKHANAAVFMKINIAEEVLLFIADHKTYEFPSNWYLLLEDEETLIAMQSWEKNKNHKAIDYLDDNDNAPDLDINDDEEEDTSSQVQGGSIWRSIFGGK